MEGEIVISFCTGDEDLIYKSTSALIAEDLVINACKYIGIGPFSRHLFALYCPAKEVWLPPCHKVEVSTGKTWKLTFLMRFRTPTIERLMEKSDAPTFNYYYQQVRNEFFDGKICDLYKGSLKDRALGLVATDIIRDMIEKNLTPATLKCNSKEFLPRELQKSRLFNSFLHEPLMRAVYRGWTNSRQSLEYVKLTYLEQLLELVPDYGSETYSVLIDTGGKVYEVLLEVNPYHSTQPGLRMKMKSMKMIKDVKEEWVHICSIEDLCYISMRNDETVEISRQNGVPQYAKFKGAAQMHSFVSLLDGYYRLTEKWTFNLCKDLTTPSLLHLRAMKCHGPVGVEFSYRKLLEKVDYEVGSYILRESDTIYDTYHIDVCVPDTNNTGKLYTLKIYKNYDGNLILDGYPEKFGNLLQLITYHAKTNMNLKRCIPPSEYDVSDLLICRDEKQDARSVSRGDCSCIAQCIPHNAMIPFNDYNRYGPMTFVYRGRLRRSRTEFIDCAAKILRDETQDRLEDFLEQCDKMLFWQHESIVSTYGIVLTSPTALVMEWLPIGKLDKYLQLYQNSLRAVDLVEAAYHISRALWYLEEQKACHGKIRCHNILVSQHSENSFKVKLADPGVISYTDADIHWIPPECYDDYSKAAHSSAADAYAFGTTLWEIFSYGAKPLAQFTDEESKQWYQSGKTLPFPPGCHREFEKLIYECWSCDSDTRKRPQAIVRDINQILYEVYNSRRSHSYAIIDTTAKQVVKEEIEKPPPPPQRPQKPKSSGINIFKNVFKWQSSSSTTNVKVPYNSLSQSTLNATSGQSTCTVLTYVEKESCPAAPPINSLDSISETDPDPSPDVHTNGGDLSWVIDNEQLTLTERLGHGFYGDVFKATLTHCSGLTSEEVAVKRIRMTSRSIECFTDLKREIEIMKNLRHKNIVEIKGLVEEPETMLVMEYLELGSLLAYLQLNKDCLEVSTLLKFAADVAEGMEYLERKHIVHRDLAARNILVASERNVKISDFGLAQFTEDHYYRMRTERNLPLRWYAVESISEGKFSHKSDVWSYGITLWEMFSNGSHPEIPEVLDSELHDALVKGKRLGLPLNCPALVYGLMRDCWEHKSHQRPTFKEVLRRIQTLQSELCS